MSTITDTILHQPAAAPAPASRDARFSALRDLLLALSLTVLAALAMESSGMAVPDAPEGAPVVQDWRGNSGSLPTAR